MKTTNPYRQPSFPNRPWIEGSAYEVLASNNVLHCDAYIIERQYPHTVVYYLVIDWREGGHKRIALDAYLIERDGLTAVWDAETSAMGASVSGRTLDRATYARVHARVIAETRDPLKLGQWSIISTLAHYVRVPEGDVEEGLQRATPRKTYETKKRKAAKAETPAPNPNDPLANGVQSSERPVKNFAGAIPDLL